MRDNLSLHQTKVCLLRRHMCVHCKAEGTYKEMIGCHLDNCPDLMVPCPNSGCEVSVKRKDMASHHLECQHETINCPYKDIGCDHTSPRCTMADHKATSYDHHLELAMKKSINQKIKLKNQDEKIKNLQMGCTPPVIKISQFSQFKVHDKSWFSAPFYTHNCGYKMCLRVDANGSSGGKGTHVSVYLHLMKGENDDVLTWPISYECTFTLLNQVKDEGHHTDSFTTAKGENTASSRVLSDEMSGFGWGKPTFIAHTKLEEKQYLIDDSLYFRVQVKLIPGIKPWLVATSCGHYLELAMKKQDEKIANLKIQLEEKLKAQLKKQDEKLETQLKKLDDKLETQLKQDEKLETQLKKLDDKLETQLKQDEKLETQLKKLETRLMNLETKITNLEMQLKKLDDKLETQLKLETRLMNLETKITNLEMQLKKQDDKLDKQLKKLEEKLETCHMNLDGKITNLETLLKFQNREVTHVFKMSGFFKLRMNNGAWDSPTFYIQGYKMHLNVDANRGNASCITVWLVQNRGEQDADLTWPISLNCTVTLLNHRGGGHIVKQVNITMQDSVMHYYINDIHHDELGLQKVEQCPYLKDGGLHFRLLIALTS